MMKNLRTRCEERGCAEVRRGSGATNRLCRQRLLLLSFLCLASAVGAMLASASYPSRLKASASSGCVGDCNDDGVVTVDEIVLLVNIVLGVAPISSCPTLAGPPDVADIVLAINAALTGCAETPTPSPSSTPTVTPTSIVTTFELAEGSTITRATGETTPIEEPLTGSFTLVLDRNEPQFLIFYFTALDFSSLGSTVTLANQEAETRMSLDCPSALAFVEVNVFIDEAFFKVSGEATFTNDCSFYVSAIEPFDLCTNFSECDEIKAGTQSGYVLRIVPVPRT